jgi:hypothetical protein
MGLQLERDAVASSLNTIRLAKQRLLPSASDIGSLQELMAQIRLRKLLLKEIRSISNKLGGTEWSANPRSPLRQSAKSRQPRIQLVRFRRTDDISN